MAGVLVAELPIGNQAAKFGDQNPKSDIEWTMYRSKQMPGPLDFDVSLCAPGK